MNIRSLTVIFILTGCTLGLILYSITYQTRELEGELKATNRAIVSQREKIHVLKAEWSLLNDPARLRELATKLLFLRPTEPTQIYDIDAIPFPSKKTEP